MPNLQAITSRYLKLILMLALASSLLLSACGFQLRGVTQLSFKNLNIQGSTLSISRDLKHALKTNGIQLIEKSEGAELLVEMQGETYEKRILSLSGGGLVREFELNYRVTFRTREAMKPTWSSVQTVQTRRDLTYDDRVLLSKAEEEQMLISDMHKDAVREVLRRLSAIKPSAE